MPSSPSAPLPMDSATATAPVESDRPPNAPEQPQEMVVAPSATARLDPSSNTTASSRSQSLLPPTESGLQFRRPSPPERRSDSQTRMHLTGCSRLAPEPVLSRNAASRSRPTP